MTQAKTIDPNTAGFIRRALSAAQAGNLAQACEVAESGLRDGADAAALHAMLGMLRCRSGDLESGVASLRAANKLRPDDPAILTNLTAALIEQRNFDAALEVATRERAEADANLQLARFRGFAAQSVGRFADAVEAYEHLVSRAPADWEAWNNLGNARSGMGDHQGSVDALEQALRLNPDSAPTRLNLAREQLGFGRLDEAEWLLREAIARNPADKPATVDLAALQKRLGNENEVVDLLAEAVKIDPRDEELQVNYGAEARNIRRNDVAENAFKQALALSPSYGPAFIHLATLLDHLNREDEIPALIERAQQAEAQPGVTGYMRALDHRRAGRFREGLETLTDGVDIGDAPRLEMLRGQFYDGLGEHDLAFEAFSRMNELFRADPSLPEERAAKYRETITVNRELVTKEWLQSWRLEAARDPRPSPAFLVGFPRSGTTLLDTMLMSHPRVEVMEEEPALQDANRVLKDFAELPSASDQDIQAARDAYFKAAASLIPLKPGNLAVDKNPLVMNALPFVYRLFPDARVILAVRHPCDVVLSCFITNFKLNMGMANFIRLDTTAELYDLSFRYVERVMEVFDRPIHRICYENIVSDRERELRGLLDFLDLDWSDEILDHQKTARNREHIKTASYSQVVEPIYTRASGRWQNYRKHLEPVFPILEPWVEKFGYTL